VNSTQHWG